MDEFAHAAEMAGEMSKVGESTQTRVLIVALAFVGFIGRLVVVAYGDRIAGLNPLRSASGGVMIGAAVLLIAGGIFLVNGHVKTLIMVRQHSIDPFLTSVLGRDSCDVASGAYCVVVFENEREIVVNWHDKRVHMMALLTPPMNPPWGSLRPRTRASSVDLTSAAVIRAAPDDVTLTQ